MLINILLLEEQHELRLIVKKNDELDKQCQLINEALSEAEKRKSELENQLASRNKFIEVQQSLTNDLQNDLLAKQSELQKLKESNSTLLSTLASNSECKESDFVSMKLIENKLHEEVAALKNNLKLLEESMAEKISGINQLEAKNIELERKVTDLLGTKASVEQKNEQVSCKFVHRKKLFIFVMTL